MLVVLVASCGGSEDTDDAPDGNGATAGDTTGVTDDAIQLSVLVVGGAVEEQAEAQLGAARQQWQAFVDEVNESGGVDGRRLEPTYVGFDPIDGESMNAACIETTEDANAFAALNVEFFGAVVVPCLTRDHETPMLMWNTVAPEEIFEASDGRLFTVAASAERGLGAFARELDARGVLEGRTIGVVYADIGVYAAGMQDALIGTLEDQGHEVAVESVLGGIAESPAQVPIEIQAMKDAGVDTVLFAPPFGQSTQFATEADEQGFTPDYFVPDRADGTTDTFAQALPGSFVGTGFTALRTGEAVAGVAEPELDAECRETYEAATGESLGVGSDPYRVTMGACTLVRLFTAAATAAGPELTREGFVEALEGLDDLPLAFFGGGSFGPDKHDAADVLRQIELDPECACWVAVEEFGEAER